MRIHELWMFHGQPLKVGKMGEFGVEKTTYFDWMVEWCLQFGALESDI